ncbi:MAG: hypothetical protein ACNA8O_12515 [Cyanobacteriota bacterium]|jgi:hypothetical protein
MNRSRRSSLFPVLLALSASLGAGLLPRPAAGADNFVDAMVRKYCVQAVQDEVKASGKPAPEGMVDYTCDCVVQEMKKRQSIDQAKNTCKAAAASKFDL